MEGVGLGLTVIVFDALPVHPLPFVTVTVNVPLLVALTLCVVALFDHK